MSIKSPLQIAYVGLVKRILPATIFCFFLTGCGFIQNTLEYKNSAKVFIETLINEDYNQCIELIAIDQETAKKTDVETLKTTLKDFRENIVTEFGEELDYTFMRAEKKFSTIEEGNAPPNTTLVFMQISNETEFRGLQILFDDQTKKILSMNLLDLKKPIPDLTFFWMFALPVLCVLAFNIYIIRKIRRSDLKRKWLKYVSVLFFNVPTISYSALGLLSVKINFQFLFGVAFNYMGFSNAAWEFGLPLGGLYWFLKLRHKKNVVRTTDVAADLIPMQTSDH